MAPDLAQAFPSDDAALVRGRATPLSENPTPDAAPRQRERTSARLRTQWHGYAAIGLYAQHSSETRQGFERGMARRRVGEHRGQPWPTPALRFLTIWAVCATSTATLFARKAPAPSSVTELDLELGDAVGGRAPGTPTRKRRSD